MSNPAAAKRGGKGKAPRAKKAASKKRPAKKAPTKRGKDKTKPVNLGEFVTLANGEKPRIDAKRQEMALAIIKTDHPTLTAEAYALAYSLPSDDVFRMQRFAMLYVRTMDKKQAALLMGYDDDKAPAAAALFFAHVYTQLYISEILASAKVEEIVSVGQLMAAAWKEANKPDKVLGKAVVTNSTTRLKALALCGQWLRLGAPPEKAPPGGPALGGGVMLVPGDLSPDEWESHAMREQRQLKDAVAIDAEILPPNQ